MKKTLFAALFAAVVLFLGPIALSSEAYALTGDGLTFVNCNGRYTITNRYWGVARMSVYGCSNGYVYVYVTSGTTWGKAASITRNNPYNSRYADTYGRSLYSVTTEMLVYTGGTCYTAQGSSQDSNYGSTQYFSWCR